MGPVLVEVLPDLGYPLEVGVLAPVKAQVQLQINEQGRKDNLRLLYYYEPLRTVV